MCLLRVPGELIEKVFDIFLNTTKVNDSKTFGLFYLYTFIFIALCSFLTTIQEFFGDPIYCNPRKVSMIVFYHLILKLKKFQKYLNKISPKIGYRLHSKFKWEAKSPG